MNNSMEDSEAGPAQFESQLGLPAGQQQYLLDAAHAVRQEYRDGSRWKRLQCRKVSVVAERERGAIYVVDVGTSVQFDWTWEGAQAFRSTSLDNDTRLPDPVYGNAGLGNAGLGNAGLGNAGLGNAGLGEADYEDAILWSGEIVEVDERNGCLYLSLDDPAMVPSAGPFFVRPFEFLSVLDSVYSSPEFAEMRQLLPDRLNATTGDVHPANPRASRVGLPHLQDWWQHTWSILWGPPGTGKTWTTGQQIAQVLRDDDERILVVSTTNRATDAAAFSIGQAALTHCPQELAEGSLLRLGKGAAYQTFLARNLDSMLRMTESEILSHIDELGQQLQTSDSREDKALIRKQIGELRRAGGDQSHRNFVAPEKRVIVATAFRAISFLKDETIRKMIAAGAAPFTTLFIDEAGLISRAVVAALSLLAARRIVLVGDSKQLAPISRISRILPTRQQMWLASSGLSHLDKLTKRPPAVHLLSEQRRMHPSVCQVVSAFQYDGVLTTAKDRAAKESNLSAFIAKQSRAIWYVADEEDADLSEIRASRGPGNKSWIRGITPTVLEKFFSDAGVRSANGLFISPFVAQAQVVAQLLVDWQIPNWQASTVHSQQGVEADIIFFDTVNASSYNWPFDEWKRLINVALSRAREAVIVLASRSEMEEPYLRPLQTLLKASVFSRETQGYVWRDAGQTGWQAANRVAEPGLAYSQVVQPPNAVGHTPLADKPAHACRMGDQFAQRRDMKPVLSREQQRLTNLVLDGRPRLVRGVAGSGKSIVLCNWLARTAKRLNDAADSRIWAVYANRSLHKLLRESIESAWKSLHEGQLFREPEFPWHTVSLVHVRDVLAGLLPSAQLSIEAFGFEYDRAAEAFLSRQDTHQLLPRCAAMFIDEAQDMGPSTLRLLLSIVEQSDEQDPNSRAAHIFHDNAQNVYGTKTPKWSEFGLDMRGRSTIMRESFRSTTPITELAVNVLNRLSATNQRQDQQELLSLGLIEKTSRNGEDWLRVRFNQVDGPKPIYRSFENRSQEMAAIARHLKHLILIDGISPADICMLYNGRAQHALESQLTRKLAEIGVELSFQKNRAFERQDNTLIATTPHSYKGYESEVIVIPCVDSYVALEGKVLENSLYVAMTRARSLLAIYGIQGSSDASRRICDVLTKCIATQNTYPLVESLEDENYRP